MSRRPYRIGLLGGFFNLLQVYMEQSFPGVRSATWRDRVEEGLASSVIPDLIRDPWCLER
ncbi:hypothetical protein SAMN05428950_1011676 [Sphingomonas sp. OV641]|uniref:hypothetical protein n=1 Tax=Sphingomonas sp. OV641 TaxID=1881068 RepID=UPI0008BEB7EE|nr:hypothetical protein [Sphingomonas sp. OV641]SEJ27608.1 hypothetical protein SAMN05428950_1011676 [Sphingomonas sp. OV641]